jgi:serine/threonine protein kinase
MAAGLRIGRYELGERLGTGGFGVVYHARDTELGRELAIKVLRPEYQTQPDVIARFLKEARAAAKIDHPGIVTVFECGTIANGSAQDGNAFIAMELLRGFSLTQHLEQRGRLALADAILIARQVAAALAVAHAAGIVHRDLKPDNVFLLPDSLVKGGFRIKILDFGVAKLAEPKEVGVNTHSQMMLGTPKYMSPEQARSARAVDQRTDVYTLGCMLYEMLTGQAPYEGPGAIDMIIQHTTAPIPSPRAIVHDLPEAMDTLIRKMLGKEPDDRPDSMQAIDKALEAIQLEYVAPSGPQRPRPPTSPRAPHATPSDLTPTPPVTTVRTTRPTPAPPLPPARPTPAPPMRPTPQPPPRPSQLAIESAARTLDEEVTTSAEPRTTMRRQNHAPLLLGAGVLAAVAAAVVVFLALRKPEPAREAKPTAVANKAMTADDIARLAKDCEDLERALFWKDLKECSERLKPYDKARAEQLFQKADDEAANEKKYKALQKYIADNELEKARVLVKRITSSVYTDRAHKLLEEAEAQKQ